MEFGCGEALEIHGEEPGDRPRRVLRLALVLTGGPHLGPEQQRADLAGLQPDAKTIDRGLDHGSFPRDRDARSQAHNLRLRRVPGTRARVRVRRHARCTARPSQRSCTRRDVPRHVARTRHNCAPRSLPGLRESRPSRDRRLLLVPHTDRLADLSASGDAFRSRFDEVQDKGPRPPTSHTAPTTRTSMEEGRQALPSWRIATRSS